MARQKELRTEALEVLRARHEEVVREKDRLFMQASLAERDREKLGAKLHGVEQALEAAMSAIAVLAGATTSKTVEGRMAREGARQLLGQVGIKPPSALGPSRTKARSSKKTRGSDGLRRDLKVLRQHGKTIAKAVHEDLQKLREDAAG